MSVHVEPVAIKHVPLYGLPPLYVWPLEHESVHPTSNGQPPPETVTALVIDGGADGGGGDGGCARTPGRKHNIVMMIGRSCGRLLSCDVADDCRLSCSAASRTSPDNISRSRRRAGLTDLGAQLGLLKPII